MAKNRKFQQVFSIFKQNYVLIPLEVFGDDPYKTLVSTLLSSRTNDDTTLPASKRLFKKTPNISKLNKLSDEEIKKLIYPVGFYKTKAKHLTLLTEMVLNKFGGVIPNTREELMTLPGVGRKTANLVLNRAFNKPAIAVDTHVHRISNVLGWVNTNSPEQTEKVLNKIIPKKYWSETNNLFVSIGRQYTTTSKLKDFLKKHKLI